MTEEYPVYAKLTEQKLSQMGLEATDLTASPLDYVDPSWHYIHIFKLLVYFQHRVESTIGIISNTKNSSSEVDSALKTRLDELIQYLEQVKSKIK